MFEKSFCSGNEGWPVLLVDGSGKVLEANGEAVSRFGSTVQAPSAHLSAIWPQQNAVSPEDFLAQWRNGPQPLTRVQLLAANRQTFAAQACVCNVQAGSASRLLVQFLPEPSSNEADGARQKLECALQLARTVALDFNNALTSILGHTSLILAQMEPDHPWRSSLLQVEKSASKAAEIANDLGTFSRQEKTVRPQPVGNLNNLLQRTVEVFRQDSGPAVEWSLDLEPGLFASKFDEAKLQQACLKVLENGIQALPESGRLTVQTRNLELPYPTQDGNLELAAGTYVCAEISDTGCGIHPEVLPRIFDPFFTTKAAPHRGLGLALVYGILTNHGGGVAVSSKPGTGTSVRLYLPAEGRVATDNGHDKLDLNGTQTVLFVDDEDLLRTMAQVVLSSYGYRALTAETGQKALEILKNAPVDVLITDLVMPGMSGRELVEQARSLSPELRILCTTGYVRPPGQSEDPAYLQKPFTAQELLSRVKLLLTNGLFKG